MRIGCITEYDGVLITFREAYLEMKREGLVGYADESSFMFSGASDSCELDLHFDTET